MHALKTNILLVLSLVISIGEYKIYDTNPQVHLLDVSMSSD